MVFVTLFTKGPTKVQLRKTHDSVLEGFVVQIIALFFKGHNLERLYIGRYYWRDQTTINFPENTLIIRPVFF